MAVCPLCKHDAGSASYCPHDGLPLFHVGQGRMAEGAVGRDAGPYRLEEELGRGAMAIVYRGRHRDTGEDMAVKVLNRTVARHHASLARFAREANAAARIEHPNVVRMHQLGFDRFYYLVMEYLPGLPLDVLIADRDVPIPFRVALAYLNQIAAGVAAAHALGIVHRDLKPGNIMVQKGRVKVLDFGLAKEIAAGSGAFRTKEGDLLGSPDFMSPEQWRGEVDVDQRADVYAFGVLAYLLMTGRLPFRAANPIDKGQLHIMAPVPPMERQGRPVPGALEVLVRWCLSKDRADRAAHMGRVHRELLDIPRSL